MGTNSTSVMPGIEIERAFSALAPPVRLPSPLGWAGMMGAVGAPRFGAQRCPTRTENQLRQEFLSLRQHKDYTCVLRLSGLGRRDDSIKPRGGAGHRRIVNHDRAIACVSGTTGQFHTSAQVQTSTRNHAVWRAA